MKDCCKKAWQKPDARRFVVSLALVDPESKKWYLFEATPDIKEQLHYFRGLTNGQYGYLPSGIFLTHAHIGHYAGLMQLGREVMGAKEVPVYVMPKMKSYLETNGPWSQLITLNNIKLISLQADVAQALGNEIEIIPFTVPHRDEYSETAGFKMKFAGKRGIFIPDIDKWEKWASSIVGIVGISDFALLDATFYGGTELPGRKISDVPHPYVTETMALFKNENAETRAKIHFIHINHTNPLFWDRKTQQEVEKAGFHIAKQGEKL
jgi:pyrroloquinoline quinone biosynthesis protein B